MARARAKAASRPAARWLREAQGVAVLGAAAYVALALLSYDPGLAWVDQEGRVGVVGLWLGWALFTAVGYAAYLLPVALAGWAVTAVLRPLDRVTWSVAAGAVLGLVGLTGLLARTSGWSGGVHLHRGGLAGRLVSRALRQTLGDAGSLVVLLTLLAVAGLCLTQLSYARATRQVATGVARLMMRRPRRRAPVATTAPVIAERGPEPPAIAVAEPAGPTPRAPVVAAPPVRERPRSRPAERTLVWQEAFAFAGSGFQLPPLSLLRTPPPAERRRSEEELRQNAEHLRKRLEDFGVDGRIVQINPGPVITGYEFEPARGVKVTQVVNLADDLALAMKAGAVRVFGPVPGRGTVAIEVPNPEPSTVALREMLASKEFAESKAPLPLALGKDAIGQPAIHDLAQMPHLLVAGATGAGKSAALNAMICSILYRRPPSEVRFLMIDPKRLELGMYDGIPHLLAPVVTDAKEAAARLRWIVGRMDERYRLLASKAVRNIEGYNREVDPAQRLPYWVVIVDELADLMMVSAGEVETALARLAQIARAVGIHLVVATQRPSVDVITGLIKANFPARIAFQVATKVDSRTILDQNGAEALLGRGDMLFVPPGASRPIRVHGAWVSEAEVREIAGFLRKQGQAVYEEGLLQPITDAKTPEGGHEAERDDTYWRAVELVVSQKQASISFIQRRMGLGYPKAARFIDLMEQDRIIGPGDGAKPRQILVGPDYLSRRGQAFHS
ncbi:MAG TPA: DNA translocase FtsK 4TM domain-containing protein [Methylomirabilota bacterium]|nr:DNA translocase FtsK 4TM domain-containing protein [Methylomirabilota bacterium]